LRKNTKEYTKAFNTTIETARKVISGFVGAEDTIESGDPGRLKKRSWKDETRAGVNDAVDYINYIREFI